MVNAPIWRDTPYTGSTEPLYFDIEDSTGNTVYSGVAEAFPNETAVTLYVNRLVADFLSAELDPLTDGVQADSGACQTFTLKESGTTLETYRFLLCSNGEFDGTDRVLSQPVNGHMDPRMKVPYTRFCSASRTVTMEVE